jgi:hypothetical protein
MLRRFSYLFLLVPLCTCPGPILADAKRATRPNEVEVRFRDGSTMRMLILQDVLDIDTRYGRLTVPTNEVRKIEFGFRISDELARKIEAAIRRLSDASFEKRQEASQQLTEIGAPAWPALQTAARSEDPEVARRVRDVMDQIRERVPASRLKFVADDVVQTIKFTIAGRILNPTIKARSAYFSDGQVQTADLRSMRWLLGGDAELAVEAAQYGSAANQWLETEIQVSANDRLLIVASGQVDLWPQQPGSYVCGPNGYSRGGGRGPHLPGTLLGRIGEGGKVFVIGQRFEGTVTEEGLLYLHIVPSPWDVPSTGSYVVKISSGQ